MDYVNEILRAPNGEIIGKGFSMNNLRDKINEIVDYINAKEGVKEKVESEDERIRKQLVSIVSFIPEANFSSASREDCRAYLEKLKENIEREYVFRPLAGTDITTAAGQAIRRVKEGDHLVLAFNGAYLPVRKYNSAKELIDEYDAYLEKQKEQKSNFVPKIIRPKFAVGDTVCRNMWSDHTIREIYIDCDDPVYICINEEGIESHISFSEQDGWKRKEQKPVEWSEEDIKKIRSEEYTKGFNDAAFGGKLKEWSEKDEYYFQTTSCGLTPDELAWLKSLKDRVKSQPKQEWSEKDEEIREEVIGDLCALKDWIIKYDANWLANPVLKNIGKRIAWLKFLRPSWKPSDEQMSSLWQASIYYKSGKIKITGEQLESLYNDLQKL